MRALKKDRFAAIRTEAIIAGDKDVVLLRAPVSTAQQTVITPALAEHIGADDTGPVRCTESALGRFCGFTQRVTVALDDCSSVAATAIVAPIRDREIGPMIIGTNILRRARPILAFSPGRSLQVTCRVRRRKRSIDLGWL